MSDFVRNAVITGATLSTADHGILSGWLFLDFGGSGQGFGGLVLSVLPQSPHWPGSGNYAGVWIARVLEIAGVSTWDALKGKTIRVRKASEWGDIMAIGHIVKDVWFEPAVEFASLTQGAA